MSRKIKPSFYTKTEGGLWLRTPEDFLISVDELENNCVGTDKYIDGQYAPPTVRFGSYPLDVHSLLFNCDQPDPNAPRWDCINGWTRGKRSVLK